MTTGLILCSCGKKLNETLDYKKITENIEQKDVKVLQLGDLCLTDGLNKLKDFTAKEGIDRLVIAACTPQNLEKKVESSINGAITEFVCLREHCAWPHLEEKAAATRKASILINIALMYIPKKEKVEKRSVDINKSIAVIGGGISGLSAALELRNNSKVYLIEKSDQLGGNLNNLYTLFPTSLNASEVVQNKITEIKAHNGIEVFLNSTVTNIDGIPGSYVLTIENGEGATNTYTTGSVLIATGFEESAPKDLGLNYPITRDIITQTQLSRLLKTGKLTVPSTGIKPEKVVMINCVGSRCSENFYCSKICCSYSIHNALHLVEQGIDTTIVYMDIRTPYKNEQIYREAREKGITFIRGNTQSIETADGVKLVSVEDTLTNDLVELTPDLIVLSTALIPSQGTQELADLFHLPIKESNYISELYGKTNAAQTMMKGIFIAGSAQFPMSIPESISHASSAAMKALKFINKNELEIENETTIIDEDLCIGCGNCAEVCQYDAATLEIVSETDEEIKRIAKIETSKCRGCGTCSAICPTGATKLLNYDRESLFAKIEGIAKNFYKTDGKDPLIITLSCKECAYCGIDLAGISDYQYPANVFVIDIPCAGRIGPIDILKAFVEGADSVIISRCPEKSCHYRFGNENAKLVTEFTKNILDEIGFNGNRLELLELISAEPDKFGKMVTRMNQLIKEIGRNPTFKR